LTGAVLHYLTRPTVFLLSTYGSTALVDLGRLFSFLIYAQSVGLLERGSARRKPATQTQNIRTQTSMPLVGLEPTITVLEKAKAVHALDPADTVIGLAVFL
jgi:hypothetical protein